VLDTVSYEPQSFARDTYLPHSKLDSSAVSKEIDALALRMSKICLFLGALLVDLRSAMVESVQLESVGEIWMGRCSTCSVCVEHGPSP
jgi:hypothetical protein